MQSIHPIIITISKILLKNVDQCIQTNFQIESKEILFNLVFELNNELRSNAVFKQRAPLTNQQVRPTAAIPIPSSGLSSSRLTLDIDTLEREYNSRPPPTISPQILQKIQQHPVSIQTTSTPLPPPPLNGSVTATTAHQKKTAMHRSEQITQLLFRKRPLNKRELTKKDNDVITIPNRDHCLVHVPKSKVDLTKYFDNQTFKFDYTFDEKASTELVYHYTAASLIDTIFNGGHATVFAYGQTGSGKTFTMGGDLSSAKIDYSHGIYAQTARDIFHRLSQPQYRSSVEIFVTFYEIYCGKVFDLLNNKKRLRVFEDQKGLVQVCDRKEQQVKSVHHVLNIIQRKSILFIQTFFNMTRILNSTIA
ncbi:unnamed protein product [Rotaria sp. Silwood2]|nr:unnamed protein product [Rotaria sp. Silwood2]